MHTRCTIPWLELEVLFRRSVEVTFDGGRVTSDAGLLLVREVDQKFEMCWQLAACFSDHRNQDFVEFSGPRLVRQRIFGLVAGYEDLNDHDRLRHDPMLALAIGRPDILGTDRRNPERDAGKGAAGKSTLNRMARRTTAAHRQT
jgi:hypothetical protein